MDYCEANEFAIDDALKSCRVVRIFRHFHTKWADMAFQIAGQAAYDRIMALPEPERRSAYEHVRAANCPA